MSFTDDQKAALSAPLAREHVKARQQAGRNVSYIEGWLAIAEANRIFGFDGWESETIECRCVSEKPCEIGQQKRPGFRVAYVGKVRITVRAGDRTITREGTGYGSGIDADVGEAHESAAKECETDARKRALMTFGNPFGLALYDKTQSEVEPAHGGAQRPPAQRSASPPSQPPTTNAAPPAGRAGQLPAPNPEEPPEVARMRQAERSAFWNRSDYGINPEVIQGGLARWDAEFLAQAEAAPNLDAFLKLKQDNKEAGFVSTWENNVATPVIRHFREKLVAIERRLGGAMAA